MATAASSHQTQAGMPDDSVPSPLATGGLVVVVVGGVVVGSVVVVGDVLLLDEVLLEDVLDELVDELLGVLLVDELLDVLVVDELLDVLLLDVVLDVLLDDVDDEVVVLVGLSDSVGLTGTVRVGVMPVVRVRVRSGRFAPPSHAPSRSAASARAISPAGRARLTPR
jgi:hypothetical protein